MLWLCEKGRGDKIRGVGYIMLSSVHLARLVKMRYGSRTSNELKSNGLVDTDIVPRVAA